LLSFLPGGLRVHLPSFTAGREGAAAPPVSGLGGSCRTILGACIAGAADTGCR
jgi:hypothetical protein